MDRKDILLNKQRIVIKVGTSTITYEETGNINLEKLEKFVRILINLRNKGKEVIVVSSGAVGVGKNALGMDRRPQTESEKQACAAVGQGKLMMIYEKLFNEYGQLTAQVLLTKESVTNTKCRKMRSRRLMNFLRCRLFRSSMRMMQFQWMSFSYGNFGDNDTLAAYVSRLVEADLLILMSDIDGLYTDDPRKNPNARFIHTVGKIGRKLENMAKGTSSECGTGGMATKIKAAKIATAAGADMIIANGDNIYSINEVMNGKKVGTLFLSAASAGDTGGTGTGTGRVSPAGKA